MDGSHRAVRRRGIALVGQISKFMLAPGSGACMPVAEPKRNQASQSDASHSDTWASIT